MRVTQDTLFQFVQQITGQHIKSLQDFNSGVVFIEIMRKLFPQVYKLNSDIVQNNIALKPGPEQARQNYDLIMLLLKQNNFPSNLFKQTLFELGDKQQIQDFLVMMFYIHQLQIGNTQQIAIELKVSKSVTAFLLSDDILQIIQSGQSDVDNFINELQDISISNVDELLRKSVFRSDVSKSQPGQLNFEEKQEKMNASDHNQITQYTKQPIQSQLVQKQSKINQTGRQDQSAHQGNANIYSQTYQYKPPAELISTRPLTGTTNSNDIREKQKQVSMDVDSAQHENIAQQSKFDDAPEVLMSLIQNPNNKSMKIVNDSKLMLQNFTKNTNDLIKNLVQKVLPQLVEHFQTYKDQHQDMQVNIQIQSQLEALSQKIDDQKLEDIQLTNQRLQDIISLVNRQNSLLDKIIKFQDQKSQDLSNDNENVPEAMMISGTLGKSTIQQEVDEETDRFSVLIFVLLRRITQLEQLQKRNGDHSGVNFMEHVYSCLQQQFKAFGINKSLLSYQQIQQKLVEFDQNINEKFNQKVADLSQAQYSDELMSLLERLRQQNDVGTLDLDLRQFFTKDELDHLGQFLKKGDIGIDMSSSKLTASQVGNNGLSSSQIAPKRGIFSFFMSKLNAAQQEEEDFLAMDRDQLNKYVSAIKIENNLNKHYISQLIQCFDILKQEYENIQIKNEKVTSQMIQIITSIQQSATAEIVKLIEGIPAAAQREAEIAYLKQINDTQINEMQAIEQQLEVQNQQLFDLQKVKRQQDALIKQQNSRQSELIQLMLRLKQVVEETGIGADRMVDINRALSAHFGQQTISVQQTDNTIGIANEQRYRDLNAKYHELQRQSAQQAAELQQHRTQYAMLQANYQALQRVVEQIQAFAI